MGQSAGWLGVGLQANTAAGHTRACISNRIHFEGSSQWMPRLLPSRLHAVHHVGGSKQTQMQRVMDINRKPGGRYVPLAGMCQPNGEHLGGVSHTLREARGRRAHRHLLLLLLWRLLLWRQRLLLLQWRRCCGRHGCVGLGVGVDRTGAGLRGRGLCGQRVEEGLRRLGRVGRREAAGRGDKEHTVEGRGGGGWGGKGEQEAQGNREEGEGAGSVIGAGRATHVCNLHHT